MKRAIGNGHNDPNGSTIIESDKNSSDTQLIQSEYIDITKNFMQKIKSVDASLVMRKI